MATKSPSTALPAGWVTSGSPGPTLNKNIGLCYLPIGKTQPGQQIQVMVRNQPVEAVVVPTPFYKRRNEHYPENFRYTKEHEWVNAAGRHRHHRHHRPRAA